MIHVIRWIVYEHAISSIRHNDYLDGSSCVLDHDVSSMFPVKRMTRSMKRPWGVPNRAYAAFSQARIRAAPAQNHLGTADLRALGRHGWSKGPPRH